MSQKETKLPCYNIYMYRLLLNDQHVIQLQKLLLLSGTTYPHINRCIERFYNKRRMFPDFLDIQKLVVLALEQENIVMAPIKVHQIGNYQIFQSFTNGSFL